MLYFVAERGIWSVDTPGHLYYLNFSSIYYQIFWIQAAKYQATSMTYELMYFLAEFQT